MLVVLVAVAVVVLIVTNAFGRWFLGGVRDNAYPSSLATVRRRSLTSAEFGQRDAWLYRCP